MNLIARFICVPLRRFDQPELVSRFQQPSQTASIMPMPKTTMDEDHLASTGKDEIGATRQLRIVEAIPITQSVNKRTNDHLGGCVLGFDQPHPGASFSFG